MSRKHPKNCEYCGVELHMQFDDFKNCYRCENCDGVVAVPCPLCGSEGFMEEDEMECDWINFDDELVTCKECDGYGWTADPSFQ